MATIASNGVNHIIPNPEETAQIPPDSFTTSVVAQNGAEKSNICPFPSRWIAVRQTSLGNGVSMLQEAVWYIEASLARNARMGEAGSKSL